MILPFAIIWKPWLKDIDIKSCEWPWCEDYWKDDVKKNIIKMWMGGEPTKRLPLGFVAYRFVNIKDLIEKDLGENLKEKGTVVHVSKLAVHPKYRNQGIGTKLLENAEAAVKLQDAKLLVMILHEEDDEGRGWLIRRGFVAQTLHKEMFPDGRDGYSFAKELL